MMLTTGTKRSNHYLSFVTTQGTSETRPSRVMSLSNLYPLQEFALEMLEFAERSEAD